MSTGAENDLQRATEMARHMVTHYGMSEKLGLATYDTQPAPMFLEGLAPPERRNCSEHTAELIDQEVSDLLAASRVRVEKNLKDDRGTLDALARLLLQKEVVDRKMLDELLASRQA